MENFDFFEATVTTTFNYRCRPNLVCCSTHTVHAYVSQFVLIGLCNCPIAAKENINLAFYRISAFSDVNRWWQCQEVEHRCTTNDPPLSSCIIFVSVLQCLHGEIGRTNSEDIHNNDEQRKKQTNQTTLRESRAYVVGHSD